MSTETVQQPVSQSDLESAVAAARAHVEEQRATLARWEQKAHEAAMELEGVQERAGEELLEDPDAEEHITATITQLQSRVLLAERAAAAQRPKVTRAESAYLAAEGDLLEEPLAQARAVLAEHEKETHRLLHLLEAHEGSFISEASHRNSLGSVIDGWSGQSIPVPRLVSNKLRHVVTLAERRLTVVRELAAGRDPRHLISEWQTWERPPQDYYPASLQGPDALVPTPAYLASVQQLRTQVSELEEAAAALPGEIEEWQSQLHRGIEMDGVTQAGLERREYRLQTITVELEQARAELAALTGVDATTE